MFFSYRRKIGSRNGTSGGANRDRPKVFGFEGVAG